MKKLEILFAALSLITLTVHLIFKDSGIAGAKILSLIFGFSLTLFFTIATIRNFSYNKSQGYWSIVISIVCIFVWVAYYYGYINI